MNTPAITRENRLGPASGGPPRQLVIMLHGYGSNGADLIELAPLWSRILPDALFLSPDAPEACPANPGGFQWWPLTSFSMTERAAGVRRAAPALNAYIDAQLSKYGLTDDKLALVGFSQGTMMALQVGPRRERAIAGILAYSGMIADEAGLETEAVTKPPVLLVHGDADPMLPPALFHQAKATLERLGFPLTSHLSPRLGHGIDPDGLRLGEQFLAKVLG